MAEPMPSLEGSESEPEEVDVKPIEVIKEEVEIEDKKETKDLVAKFFTYIKEGNPYMVSGMVSQFPELLKSRNKDDMTPLMESAYKGNAEILRFFLDSGCDPNEQGFEEYTALMMACLGGHEECVIRLLESGADRYVKNRIGKTAAAMCGFVGMKNTHRIINTWIDDIEMNLENVMNVNRMQSEKVKRFLCHPNCLPISVLQRIDSLLSSGISMDSLRKLSVCLRKACVNEGEFPIALRYQLISSVISLLIKNLTPRKLQKKILKNKHIYTEIILDSCNALSNRGETESLKRAVMTGHAELVTAVRKFIGDTADDNSICKICFEPSKLRCSKCSPTFYAIYCSLYCQKLDWNDHKAECVGTKC